MKLEFKMWDKDTQAASIIARELLLKKSKLEQFSFFIITQPKYEKEQNYIST